MHGARAQRPASGRGALADRRSLGLCHACSSSARFPSVATACPASPTSPRQSGNALSSVVVPCAGSVANTAALSTPSGAMAWLNGPTTAPTEAAVPATPLGTSRACVPERGDMAKAGRGSEHNYFVFEPCNYLIALQPTGAGEVDPTSVSPKGGYTVHDWAGWPVEQDVSGTPLVLDCLNAPQTTSAEKVDPESVSANGGYTVHAWPGWAVEQDVPGPQLVLHYPNAPQPTSAEKVDPKSGSPNGEYTVYVAGAQQVLDYLNASQPTSAAPESACHPGKSHPPSARRIRPRKYWLFAAAEQGCKRCVAHYLEVERVHPLSESGHMHYTVLDWALWAKQEGKPGADDLLDYLNTGWAMIPSALQAEGRRGKKRRARRLARTEGLATPLMGGPGTKMMDRMGRLPGTKMMDRTGEWTGPDGADPAGSDTYAPPGAPVLMSC